jgi:hypothetical protein
MDQGSLGKDPYRVRISLFPQARAPDSQRITVQPVRASWSGGIQKLTELVYIVKLGESGVFLILGNTVVHERSLLEKWGTHRGRADNHFATIVARVSRRNVKECWITILREAKRPQI